MTELKIFKEDEKLGEVYEVLYDKIIHICNQYQLTYFELFGILECIKVDLYKSNMEEKDEN